MVDINLKKLVSELKSYPGITRKGPISNVIKAFPQFSQSSTVVQVLADFGEDAAGLSLSANTGDDGVLLLAADGIMVSLMDADPYWAGYCAVLVNLHDIAAMGGIPLAMVDVISVADDKVQTELTSGMNEASTKFGVPIVGGHVHPDSDFNSVDIAVLGVAKRSSVIYSHTARVGDHVIFAMDLDGQLHPNARFAWDSTQHKDPEHVRRQLMVMLGLGSDGLVHAGKDISNPGILGTLGMLLESSKKGATVDLSKIPYPDIKKLEFGHWLKLYQGCGFVVTSEPNNTDMVIDKFNSVGLTAKQAGEVTDERKLIIKNNNEIETLFDFESESITGIEKDLKMN